MQYIILNTCPYDLEYREMGKEPQKLKLAGEIIGIELVDHVITGERNYVSLKVIGLM